VTPAPDQRVTGHDIDTDVVLAEVVRSGMVEGRHRGCVVALAADGSVAFAAGDVARPMYPRSSNKPMQAAAMLRAGLSLDGELLALAAASHAGEPFHLAGVQRILDGAGLDPSALRTPPALPVDAEEMHALLRRGGGPERIIANCSGKHAAMLATCMLRGWPLASYLDPDHPLQDAIRQEIEALAGETVTACGVDGCGAPVLAISLIGLARSFRAHVLAPEGTPERRVADAMRAFPRYVGGTRRSETVLMQGVPGLLAKPGAEAVYAVAVPDGRAVALKIADGNHRACGPVLVAALRGLGIDAPVLDLLAEVPVLGGGRPVGSIQAVYPKL
jgi:L-asparaginase II